MKQIKFAPQPGTQTYFLTCPIHDILFGGARGGGKTFGSIGHFEHKAKTEFLKHKKNGIFKGLFIRRHHHELEDVISKAEEMFQGIAVFNVTKKIFSFGPEYGYATLKFRQLDKDRDADKYQGHDYQWICIEEMGSFPSPLPIDKLRACLRSPHGVVPWFVATANPGGAGHNWIKKAYIDPSPPMKPFDVLTPLPDGTSIKSRRVYIPSKLSDNKILQESDPLYQSRVALAAGDQEWLIRAWMDGNWDIIAGGMFDDVWDREKNVIKPFKIPHTWDIYRSYDWGSSSPFSVGWWAISNGENVYDHNGQLKNYPRGTMFRIDEWYGWNGVPNTGLKLKETDIAEGIIQREQSKEWYKVNDGPADHNIFQEIGEKCLADDHEKYGIYWQRAHKGPGSRVTGWQNMRALLHNAQQPIMEHPGMFIFDTCTEFIRTVPTLQRSPKDLEDIDTEMEDHIADETRYMVSYNPGIISKVPLTGI